MIRRLAAMATIWAVALVAVFVVRAAASGAHTPQVTFADAPPGLYAHDIYHHISATLIGSLDRMPVAWAWSPDGSRLGYVLLDSTDGAYDLLTWRPGIRESVLHVEDMPFGSPPAWSPDSRSIVYVDQRQDLCILALTGGTRCLNVQPAGQPTWSPDGAAVAYLSRVRGGGLLRVAVDSGQITPLFTGIDGVNNPRWSPDGAWIAFSYEPPEDETRHLYIIAASGGEPILLTGQDGWQDQAVWSPDGQRIAYNHYPAVPNSRPDVAVIDLETRAITRVTHHPQTDTDPRWSPDGRSLAFVSDRYDVRPRLHVVPADRLDAVEPLDTPGIAMRLYAYAWRP